MDYEFWECFCGGPVYVMGILGNRIHGRCEACGMDASVEYIAAPDNGDEPVDIDRYAEVA